jgi:hypothetical protein
MFYTFLLYIIFLSSFISSSISLNVNNNNENDNNKPTIAICVTGQVGRLQPRHILMNLIHANPDYIFHLYFVLQDYEQHDIPGSEEHMNFNTGHGYRPMHWLRKSHHENIALLIKMFSLPNSKTAYVEFVKFYSKEWWINFLNVKLLNRIYQYLENQHHILNMYNKQFICAEEIIKYENRQLHKHYDYIINTREDAYFFIPMNISFLVKQYIEVDKCHLLTKSCLDWGGINMRMQLLTRDEGISFIRERLSFYNVSYGKGDGTALFDDLMVYNPEMFELGQTIYYNITSCVVNIEAFPITAVRHTYQNHICFIHQELMDNNNNECYPKEKETFLFMHMCPELETDGLLPKIVRNQPPDNDEYDINNLE